MLYIVCTVESAMKDHPMDQINMVSEDRWSLVTGSVTLKYYEYRTFCQEYLFFENWCFFMAVRSLKTGFTVPSCLVYANKSILPLVIKLFRVHLILFNIKVVFWYSHFDRLYK